MKFIKNNILRKEYISLYDGMGYTQGTGFSIRIKCFYIFGFKFISDIEFKVDNQWIRSLKDRIKADNKQQLLENKRK